MEIEVNEEDAIGSSSITQLRTTSGELESSSSTNLSTASTDISGSNQLSIQTSSNSTMSEDIDSSPFLNRATTPTIPLVLDNITNSPRSLIQDVFSNSPTIKCHDEDRLTVGSATSQIQQPVGDYIKGICF